LKKLGADDIAPKMLKRLPTSIIAEKAWGKEEPNCEEDAEKYIKQETEKLKGKKKKEEKEPPDEFLESSGEIEVLSDEKLGPYSLLMTKARNEQQSMKELIIKG